MQTRRINGASPCPCNRFALASRLQRNSIPSHSKTRSQRVCTVAAAPLDEQALLAICTCTPSLLQPIVLQFVPCLSCRKAPDTKAPSVAQTNQAHTSEPKDAAGGDIMFNRIQVQEGRPGSKKRKLSKTALLKQAEAQAVENTDVPNEKVRSVFHSSYT